MAKVVKFPFFSKKADHTPPDSDMRLDINGSVFLMAPHTTPFGVESIKEYLRINNPRPQVFNRTYKFVSSAQDVPYETLLDYPVGDSEWSEPAVRMP